MSLSWGLSATTSGLPPCLGSDHRQLLPLTDTAIGGNEDKAELVPLLN